MTLTFPKCVYIFYSNVLLKFQNTRSSIALNNHSSQTDSIFSFFPLFCLTFFCPSAFLSFMFSKAKN